MTDDESKHPDAQEPVVSLKFDGPAVVSLGTYNEMQKAVLPVVGVADGSVEPFATAFCISVSMNLVLTAWHVIDDFVDAHRARLLAGTCHLAVVYETSEPLPSGGFLGGPLPVFRVTHLRGTDLALLQHFDVTSSVGAVRPTQLADVSFGAPPVDDHCYGFGYPHLVGGPLRLEAGKGVVEFERILHATGGRVREVFPNGQDMQGKLPRWCPYFDCDAPTPSGISGGPVMTDKAGLCGVVSSSYAPFDPDDRWASNISLLTPLLGCPIKCQDENGHEVDATVHDIASDGHIEVRGTLPSSPPTGDADTLTFAAPTTWI